MVQPLRKKQSNPVTAVILVFAVFGTFVFTATPITNNIKIENIPHSSGIFTPVDHTVDWLAETTAEYRANRGSFSALRGGTLCMPIPVELFNADECLTAFLIYSKSNDFSNTKDSVPLKLRV